jgi:Patatin-like phospholipase
MRTVTMGWLRTALWLVSTLIVTGCATPHIARLPKAGAETSCITPVAQRDLVVGVSFSGGGSRAALFGAGGLEALGRLPARNGGSVLEQVDYLSSVSGGGLPTAYYALHKPPRTTPVLGPDGRMTPAYEAFFAETRSKVAQDFQGAVIRRQLTSNRFILDSASAATSMREVIEEMLLGPGTFADLAAREKNGDSPRVMFNSTLFNDGRRFLWTTLPPDATQYDFIADLDDSLANRGITRSYPEVMKKRWDSLLPVSPLELQIDPCPIPVAMAVTASASFPPLVGPITFTVGDGLDYWHTGDGGLYENLGLESMMFAFLKQLQDRKARRALILAFNSAYPFSVGFKHLRERSQPWSLFSYDFSRIPSIMEERATAYWSLFYRSMQLEGVLPDDATLRIVFLNHESAQWEDDLSDLPEACRNEQPALVEPEDVQQRIAALPTRFEIPSACDRELLRAAAAKVVAQNRRTIDDFLAGRPTQEPAR